MGIFKEASDEEYEAVRNGLSVYSFDVYDTLITRPFAKPTDLFRFMEEKHKMKGFHDARIKAESEARRCSDREDITIDDIYKMIPSEYASMKAHEIRYETTLVFPVGPNVNFLENVKDKGYKIVLISDMYLPENVIGTCLAKCGIQYDRLFVSSSYGKTKHTGSLYDVVLDEMGIEPDMMVHMGDNKHADYEIPKSRGIISVHVDKPLDIYLSHHPGASRYLSKHRSYGASMIVALDMIHMINNIANVSLWYETGFRFGGPLAYAYSVFIESKLRNDALSVFVARDGYNPMRVKDVLFPNSNNGVYVHAQRVLSQSLSDHGIPYGEIHPPSKYAYHFLYRKCIEDARHILRFLSDIFPEIPDDDSEMIAFYNDNIKRIDSERKKRKEDYERYLRGCIGGNDTIDLIDCTTMKYTSQRFVESVIGKKIHGIYLVSLAEDESVDHSSFHTKSSFAMGWMGINIDEFLLCSPEYPISGWNNGPRFISPPECEKDRASNYDDVTSGECDYARMMKTIFGNELPVFEYPDVMAWTLASVHEPGCGDLIRAIKWASDPDHKVWNSIVPGIGSIPRIIRKQLTDIIFRMNG